MVVIVGAGLTGLSVARHLRGRPCEVVEQETTPGGLCRSVTVDGFTFDYTGHLLHLRDAGVRRFLSRLLPGRLARVERRAAVFCRGAFVPYPFQANLHGLPPEVVFECVMGFVAAHRPPGNRGTGADFQEWVEATFGSGIAKYFFIPYNRKLWRTNLRNLTREWAGWAVPQPCLEEVLRGALGIPNTGMGYNASFLYPRRGGIGILPEAMAGSVKNLCLGKSLAAVNLSKKTIRFSDGTAGSYDTLVSTVPLPRLLKMIEDLPPGFRKLAPRLKYVTVHNLNIGINRSRICDHHWLYFPEPEYPFYRVGFYSNFTPFSAPKHTSSLYIEISSRGRGSKSEKELLEASQDGLRRCGILKKSDRVVARHYAPIDYGYVIFDSLREKALPEILGYLRRRGVMSLGRYGAWNYSTMEEALLEGRRAAEQLRPKNRRR